MACCGSHRLKKSEEKVAETKDSQSLFRAFTPTSQIQNRFRGSPWDRLKRANL